MLDLLRELKKFYKEGRRDLPWRRTRDPYKILVSEVMLQQTQVERVIPFYNRFIKEFPAADALAAAPLSKVLRLWSGLGYNRRAKYLREAAKVLSVAQARTRGHKHFDVEFLENLPGVGHYTAHAVAAFAYNHPDAFIETNIRTVFFHHLYANGGESSVRRPRLRKTVSDKEILPTVALALKKSRMEPREFYFALMDYGSYLKRAGVRLNSKSKHYVKQKKFEGSSRQLRGLILKLILQKPRRMSEMIYHITRPSLEIRKELLKLQQEGLIKLKAGKYVIA